MSPLQPKTTKRQKKTAMMEQTRAELLRADPHIEHLDANRAFCGLCGKWVMLDKRQKYQVGHWLRHAKRNEHVYRANAVSQIQRQAHHDESEERLPSGMLYSDALGGTLTQQLRAEKLRTDPDTEMYCIYNWNRHKNGSLHALRAAEQERQQLKLRASPQPDDPQARLDVRPNSSQDHDSEEYDLSPVSSSRSRYTRPLDLPVPEPLDSPTDPCAMGSYTLSVPNALNSSEIFDEGSSSTAGAPHLTVDHSTVTPRFEPRPRAPAISSILHFIRSELPSSLPYTIKELETTARVIHDLAEQGAMEIDACMFD